MSKRRKKASSLSYKRRTKPGDSPGLVVVDPAQPPSIMHVLAYSPAGIQESHSCQVADIPKIVEQNSVVWINVEGLGNAKLIEELGELFKIHRLALEDVVNVHQRAKVEEYGQTLFIVLRMASCAERAGTEQLSMFVCGKVVITFQEGHPGDCFDRVRQRIREGGGKIRNLDSDYLVYALIDAVVDAYYPVLERYAERLDELEELVLTQANQRVMDQLHEVKADLLILRRAIWPQREAISQLGRDGTLYMSDATRVYLRDCHDHVVQIVELVETYRELTADLRDLFMSSISNRINETMRVLTIMSTIFIPLTFIAGIYGMNFDHDGGRLPLNMPELHWYWGYPACLASMAITSIIMIVVFYRQGWIFRGNAR